MYLPQHFEETRVEELHPIITEYPLGAFVINGPAGLRSGEHTSELQSLAYLVCRLLLEKKNLHARAGAARRPLDLDAAAQPAARLLHRRSRRGSAAGHRPCDDDLRAASPAHPLRGVDHV